MPYRWPADTRFTRLELVVEARWCRTCGGALTTGDQRQHRVLTLHGPLPLVCQLAPGPRHACPAQPQTIRPEAETAMAMPWGGRGWDVVCGLGQRRCAHHWSVGQLRAALADPYQMRLSADAIATSLHRSQPRLAARPQAPDQLAPASAAVEAVRLAIDGLQPEHGHATRDGVRALACTRRWCAEPLWSRAPAEVQPRLAQARLGAERLGPPVRLWRSEKQGRVRARARGRVARGATPLWGASLPAGGGHAGVGSGQPCAGAEATHGPGLAGERTGGVGRTAPAGPAPAPRGRRGAATYP
jgi:hypothetical protein